ncbi:MAG: prolyl oligopeptidase family serine peptidase [Cellvibrionaceae bacterium]
MSTSDISNPTTSKKEYAAYGSWPSTISSQQLTQSVINLNEPQIDGEQYYWLESRPEEKGRTVIVQQSADGQQCDITPENVNVRTRIHEYGGSSYRVHKSIVYFINDADQRVYSLDINTKKREPLALSPEGHYRYADLCIDEERQQLICVCEIHKKDKQEPENCIIGIKLDGSSSTGFNIIVFGNDFYSNPRLSPDGVHLSWLTWNHPNMPWDNSECWIAELSSFGLLQKHHKVAGGVDGSRNESVFQPQWSPTGELFFVSDRNNWWNLYRFKPNNKMTDCVLEMDAEFATPQWVFGMSTYSFLNSFTLLCCYTQQGRWYLAKIDTLSGQFTKMVSPYSNISALHCNDETDTALFLGSNENSLNRIVLWENDSTTEIKHSANLAIAPAEYSTPQSILFKNTEQQEVFGFYYPPHNTQYQAADNELPPLLVMCHGGPTGATASSLNLKIQYWTNRGFAVFDINYSGSTGYGRRYRDRLKKQWGIVDVDDICCGAEHLSQQGLVDGSRMAVRGSSAGGYSVLAALTFRDCFNAGASLYGIGDLSLLAEDTHKFESRYLDQLIGPYPDEKILYQQRSPLHHVNQLTCPVIFLQGLEDKVVPPNQAEAMVKALVKKAIPVAHVTFPNEGHGFRQADNIQYALDVEYAFYASQFDLTVEETLPKVPYVTTAESTTKHKSDI